MALESSPRSARGCIRDRKAFHCLLSSRTVACVVCQSFSPSVRRLLSSTYPRYRRLGQPLGLHPGLLEHWHRFRDVFRRWNEPRQQQTRIRSLTARSHSRSSASIGRDDEPRLSSRAGAGPWLRGTVEVTPGSPDAGLVGLPGDGRAGRGLVPDGLTASPRRSASACGGRRIWAERLAGTRSRVWRTSARVIEKVCASNAVVGERGLPLGRPPPRMGVQGNETQASDTAAISL